MRLIIPLLARLVALIAALAVVALGVLICVETVAHWLGHGFVVLPADTLDRLRDTTWSDPSVTYAFAGLCATGAVLLLVAVWHRPPLTVASGADGVRVERHSLEKSLRRLLDRTDGVSGVRVRVGRKRIRARVDTTRRLHPEHVGERAREVVDAFCSRHELALDPKIQLRRRKA